MTSSSIAHIIKHHPLARNPSQRNKVADVSTVSYADGVFFVQNAKEMSTGTKEISARKVGVIFKPPALVIFYVKDGKLRKRVMPVRDLMESDNGVQLAMSSLKEKHLPYLGCVPNVHLIKLLRLLQGNSRGLTLQESLKLLEQDCNVNPDEDLNKVEDAVLQLKKETMNQTFEANRIKPGDSNFSYEVEVDFGDEGKIESGWDSDKDDFF